MLECDYLECKERLENILNSNLKIIDKAELPIDNNITFSNAYYCWVTSIFVDIRNSSIIFSEEKKENVSKTIKCFSSEIISILNDDKNIREIGIRGDCVYAIYTTPKQEDVFNLAKKTFHINTFIIMLNGLLKKSNLRQIEVGIGMATDKELVISACPMYEMNSKVWIGKAVSRASNLSSLGNKNGNPAIVFSNCSYINFIDKLVTTNLDKKPANWFTRHYDFQNKTYYTTSIIIKPFFSWIKNTLNNSEEHSELFNDLK